MSSAVLNALWTKLATTSGSGFVFDLGGRVYLDIAPEDSELPLCVYSAETTLFSKGGGGTDHMMRVVFSLFDSADTNADIVAAAGKLGSLLDGTVLSASGYDRVLCQRRSRGTPTLTDDAWQLSEEYELRGQLL